MRFLITAWAESGHLRPLLPAAQMLASAGHDVLIASDPRIEHDRAVRDVPVTTFPDPATLVDLGDAAAFRAELAKMTPEERMAASRDRFFRQAEAVTPALVEIVGKFRPDVIYREQTFSAGSLAAAVTDVPVAIFAFMAAQTAISDRFLAALRTVGAPADLGSLDKWLTIYAMPRSWIGDVPLGPTSHFVQPSDPLGEVDDGSVDALFAGLPDRATVYVTLGTTFADTAGLFQMVLDGVASLDVNVIATTGSRLDVTTIRVPPNTRVATFVPQALVFPRCDAVVAHGGYGSLMGALRAGLPVVSVPIAAADNVPNAIRLEKLGAGKAIFDSDRNSDNVATALAEVLCEPSYRTHAQAIANEITRLPPPTHAATLLARLATTRTPVLVDT